MAKAESSVFPSSTKRPSKSLRSVEQQNRIDEAREAYRTRAQRRRKGQSQTDATLYYEGTNGELYRRTPAQTLLLRQLISGAVKLEDTDAVTHRLWGSLS